MPHSLQEKKRVLTRLRRIKGQAEALERAVETGAECGALLQQIAALRGAANGLMAEVLESHLRETFGHNIDGPDGAFSDPTGEIEQLMRLLRTYLK